MPPSDSRPWPWRGANAGPLEAAREPALAVKPRFPDAFAPPPARRKHMPGGQPWLKDGKGRDWPKDRWGRPMRPLWDYPPGVRAPGEGVAPGAPGSIGAAGPVGAYRRMAAVFDAPQASLGPALAPGASLLGSAGREAPALTVTGATVGQPAPMSNQKPPAAPELRGKASFYDPPKGAPTALPGGFDPDFYGAAMYGRRGFRLGDVVRVQLQDDPTRFVDVRVNDAGPFALDAQRHPIRPLRPNPDRVIDRLARVTVTKLPAGSHEGKKGNQRLVGKSSHSRSFFVQPS
jgi:hypothetical protein